jgi:hypothetical protein
LQAAPSGESKVNKAAQSLARLSRGVKKTMTPAAIAQRRAAGFKPGNQAAKKVDTKKRVGMMRGNKGESK